MAELKRLPRQLLESNKTPDFSALGEAEANRYRAIGKTTSTIAGAIGELVKESRELEGKSLTLAAQGDLDKKYHTFKADPNLDDEKLGAFKQTADAVVSGYGENAHPAYLSTYTANMNAYTAKLENKLYEQAAKNYYKKGRQKKAFEAQVLTDKAANLAIQGEYDEVKEVRTQLEELAASSIGFGVSKEDAVKMLEDFDATVLSATYRASFRGAKSIEQLDAMAAKMFDTPPNAVNDRAINEAYSEYTKIRSLFGKATNIAPIIKNAESGNPGANHNVPTAQANEAVELYAKNYAAQRVSADQSDDPIVPDDSIVESPQDIKDINTDEVVVKSTVDVMDMMNAFQPTMQEYAMAIVRTGASNSTQLRDMVGGAFAAGNGDVAYEAYNAIQYIDSVNSKLLSLDKETNALYVDFKNQIKNGELDYQKAIDEARKRVFKYDRLDQNPNDDVFKATYGFGGEDTKKFKNLKKAFESATGHSANKATPEALKEFYDLFRLYYSESDGMTANALDAAGRQMVRTAGVDIFSPKAEGYIAKGFFPIPRPPQGDFPADYNQPDSFIYQSHSVTKSSPGLTDIQLKNQFITQLIDAAERNGNIKYPDVYNQLKEASDIDRMEVDYASQAEIDAGFMDSYSSNKALFFSQNINGQEVYGRMAMKPFEYTEQNASGFVAFQVMLQTEDGRLYEVKDENSPFNQKMVFFIDYPQRYAPEWFAEQTEQNIKQQIDAKLIREGRELYPVLQFNPVNAVANYKLRKAYKENLENVEESSRRVREVFKFLDKGDDNG